MKQHPNYGIDAAFRVAVGNPREKQWRRSVLTSVYLGARAGREEPHNESILTLVTHTTRATHADQAETVLMR